ncbi:MAG: TonB family protein [Gammaproteobacteria bacterium]|nr:TonB family protein [Gammaproteobacteria bacterium]MDH4254693.1 TonB family protein [Gammaproteobacteria bacterium]MDH5308796.1 TonB family protein [Gammaproteobacteria bacterium]
MDLPFYREYELPWTSSSGQEEKFRRILGIVLAALLVLGLIWPFLPTPEPDPYDVEELPPRFTKLLLEQQKPPPPPPPKPEPEPEPEQLTQPEPEQVAEKPPEPEPQPEPEPEPQIDRQQQAREKAKAALLPFTEELAQLADSNVLDRVTDDRPLSTSVGQAERNERSMITSKVGTASGGINTASLSRNTGGTGLGERSTTQVESPVEAVGDGAGAGGARRTGSSGKASRSREEIELVFDKNKGAIFALYNRALREDPTLEGKLVLRLTIAPSGEVTFCEIVSSELGNDELERRLVQRVKLFRFEARDVEPITTTKPIDFFPA